MSPELLTLLQPLGLLGAPLALAALVYAYRRRGVGPRRPVGSLLILKLIERRAAPRRTFKPPFRFFYELLVALTLSLAIAGVALRQGGERIALVIDTSVSMGASLGSNDSMRSWERAIELSNTELDGLSLIDSVVVWRTAPQLTPVVPTPLSPRDARALTTTLAPSFGPDGLDAGLSRILQDPAFARVILITDRPSTPQNMQRLTIRRTYEGNGASNIAISGLAVTSSRDEVSVQLRSFAEQQTNGTLTLSIWRNQTWEHIATQPFQLTANQTASLSVKLNALLSAPLRATVSTDPSSVFQNSLGSDDQAWITINGARPTIDVLSPLSLDQLGLTAISSFEFRKADSQESHFENPIIVHRLPLTERTAPGVLAIRPSQAGDALYRDVQVTRWSTSHPITSYVTVPALRFPEAIPLSLPASFEAIMSSSAGPLVSVREKSLQREVVVGFELLPFEGKRSPTTSILMLNLLKWISGSSLTTGYITIGEPLPGVSSNTATTRLDGPSAINTEGPPTMSPGLVEANNKQFAVNFFSAEESNLRSPAPLTIPNLERQPISDRDELTLYEYLASACLILLGILALGLTARHRKDAQHPEVA